MTSDQGAPRHEGGPLERIHINQLVQRNTLESVVFTQKTRRIETAKKAFVRQNTRDECEMKTLLQRLQQEQTTPADGDSDLSSDSRDSSDHDDSEQEDGRNGTKLSNPYPVTIVPRFAAGHHTKPTVKAPTKPSYETNNPEDGPQNPSTPRMSTVIEPPTSTPRGDNKPEWLGSPSAISSVRRPRKSVAEQMHMKITNRTQNDPNWCLDSVTSSPPSELSSPTHSRSNSLKERKSGNRDISPRNANVGRRGGSLKERKSSCGTVPTVNQRQMRLARSYTTLTKTSLTEFDELKTGDRIKRQHSLKEFNPKAISESEPHVATKPRSRQNSLKEKRNQENVSNAKPVLQRTGSKKKDKQPLSPKSSNEEKHQMQDGIQSLDDPSRTTSIQHKLLPDKIGSIKPCDENLQKTTWTLYKKQAYRPTSKMLGQSTSVTPNNSPNISPLAREGQIFKY